jgi:N-acetylglucosamine-6-sulfatase
MPGHISMIALSLGLMSCSDIGPADGERDAGGAVADSGAGRPDASDGPPPNFVYIVADDLDAEMMQYMPKTRQLVRDQGVELRRFYTPYSLCTPSRVAVLTGQYPHNNRVFGNDAPDGGHSAFVSRGAEASTIAVWLQAAGYRTALIGKYVNGYPADGLSDTYQPPGWTDWYVLVRKVYDFYDYVMVENGRRVGYGSAPRDYSTDVIARRAAALIGDYEAEDDRPFFLYVAPTAPHGPAVSAPRHADLFGAAQLPDDPSFDEPKVADKPAWIRAKPRFDGAQIDAIRTTYRKRLRSLQAVDDLVETVVEKLAETGELDRTILVFTSDNGYKRGQHRLPGGKTTAYEPDILLPLYIRGPGVASGQTREHLALTIDLAPTFADLAGVASPGVDGTSLRPILGDGPADPAGWRSDFLVINRPSGTEPGAPRYNALRSGRHAYVETGDERELYDLEADPYQLGSRHDSADPTLLTDLSARLEALLGCAGAACR